MKTREKVKEEILNIKSNQILCELPTGWGKSNIALEFINKNKTNFSDVSRNVLIVVPRLVLITNWKEEFIKWGYKDLLQRVEFVTYVSFPKKAGTYDIIIFDECHHLSERCAEAVKFFNVNEYLLLSATVNREVKQRLHLCFPNLFEYKVSMKTAIESDILPDPKVFLIPLTLDNTNYNCTIIKNKKKGNPITISFFDRWNYRNVKDRQIIIRCTQQQYYDDISSLIYWYKDRIFNPIFKNQYLRLSGERIKWLSNQKTAFIKTILKKLRHYRTLTFCNSINHTEELGRFCINSKNKNSSLYLEQFNEQKIHHITACNCLDEGVNITNCRIGIYATLNSSERMIKQKVGRLLRHSNPIIILPFFVNTRDEELVKKMCEDYNPQQIFTITDIKDLKL